MHSLLRACLLSSFLIALLTQQALARTWHVTVNGSGEAPTIQAGIDSAAVGDTVLVSDGVYTGTGNKDLDFHGKNLVVRSENGPEAAIIDCQGTGRGFSFHSGESVGSVVQGLTIRNGSAPNGGGVDIAGSRPKIRDCWLLENTATYTGGGGIAVWDPSGETRIVHCVLAGNTAPLGGGLKLDGWGGSVYIDSCLVTGNVATREDGIGGGICTGNPGLFVRILRSTIAGNRAVDQGGGIGIPVASDGYTYVGWSIIWGNGAAVGDEMSVHAPADVEEGCCLDTSGVDGLGSLVDRGWITADPLFCELGEYLDAPTSGGDYTLDAASPCLPGNNRWGWSIGALGQGCDIYTSVASGPFGGSSEPMFSVSPNPSRGSFTIRYSLPSRATSSLAVFDIAGRLVRVLDVPGAHGTALWDGKDGTGRDVSPGVYFVRVSDRDFTDTRRVILVR